MTKALTPRLVFSLWFSALLFLGHQYFSRHGYLFQDGAWDIHASLATDVLIDDASRIMGRLFHRGWAVLAKRHLNVTDPEMLISLFGVSATLVPIVSALLCWLIVRRKNPALILLPLWSFLFSHAETYPYSFVETHLAAAAFWPLVLAIWNAPKWKLRPLLLGLFSAVLAFSYEASALLLGLAVLYHLYRNKELTQFEKSTCSILLIAGILQAILSVSYYRGTEARNLFFESARFSWFAIQPSIWLAAIAFISLLIVHLRGKRGFFFWAVFAVAVIKIIIAITSPTALYFPHMQWHTKSLLIFVPFFLCMVGVQIVRKAEPARISNVALPLIAYLGAMVLVVFAELRLWTEYVNAFENILETRSGIIAAEETPFLVQHGNADIAGYHCKFSGTSLSIWLQAIKKKPIKAVVLNVPTTEPFDLWKQPGFRMESLVKWEIPGLTPAE